MAPARLISVRDRFLMPLLLLQLSSLTLIARRVAPRHVRSLRSTAWLGTGAIRGAPLVMSQAAEKRRMTVADATAADWERVVTVLQPFVKDGRMDRLQRVVSSRRAGLHLVVRAGCAARTTDRRPPLTLLSRFGQLENVHDPHNAAAVLRTAEGLGLQHIHIVESVNDFQVPAPPPAKSARGATHGVAMGCSRWLSIKRYKSSLECATALREQGIKVLASDCPPAEAEAEHEGREGEGGGEGAGGDGGGPECCGGAGPARPLGEIPMREGEAVALVFGNERRGVSVQAIAVAACCMLPPCA